MRLLVGEYVDHSHRERNHQGLDNQLLQRPPPPVSLTADVQRRERLGGLLNFYHREAAGAVGRLNAPYGEPSERLEQAVAAYAEALKERPRARVPLDWAATQNNLDHAIQILRERGRA